MPPQRTTVHDIEHKDSRTNIPTEELRDFVDQDELAPRTMLYPRDPSLDPQLVWKGKAEQDQLDLTVSSVPIYIQEEIQPKSLINDLFHTSVEVSDQPHLFPVSVSGTLDRTVDFYQHEQEWRNRLILGDSLLVMTSLAEKEDLRGRCSRSTSTRPTASSSVPTCRLWSARAIALRHWASYDHFHWAEEIMRRLNVRVAQIDACIRDSMFAIPERPLNPELRPGELLLLQLNKQESSRLKIRHRINFALVFSHLERDHDGSISRRHWPTEGRTWKWIVYASATIPTIPFNLEDLDLSQDYSGQTNPRYIQPADEHLVKPFIQWALAQTPEPDLQLVKPLMVAEEFGEYRTLEAVYNHDRIATLESPTRTVTGQQFLRNPALADTLKSYYDHHCQVCGNDFEPTYGVPFAESHHIHYLRDGGRDVSRNIVVLCPNHHRIVHATQARFDSEALAYDYPNGLREKLILPNHLLNAPNFDQVPL